MSRLADTCAFGDACPEASEANCVRDTTENVVDESDGSLECVGVRRSQMMDRLIVASINHILRLKG